MESLDNMETKRLEHNSTVNIIINELPERSRNLIVIKVNHKPNYVYHISEVEISFTKIQDTKHLEKLLSICCNLGKVIIAVTEEFIDNLLTEGNSRDGGGQL